MAITTYAELLTAIPLWANRTEFGAQLADFIVLAETIFNYGEGEPGTDAYIPPLRVHEQETTASITITSGSGSLPLDFIEAIRVSTGTQTLRYVTPIWYLEHYPSGQSTDPSFYTIIGSSIYSGTTLSLVYYAKISAIATALNWLLTKSPNVYLQGGIYQLYLYDKDGEKAATHRALMAASLAGLRGSDGFSRANAPQRRSSMAAW